MNHTDALAHLIGNFNQLDELTVETYGLARKVFPVGSTVLWTHGDFNRTGTVVDHAKWGGRVKVKGATGAEYWIDLRQLIP